MRQAVASKHVEGVKGRRGDRAVARKRRRMGGADEGQARTTCHRHTLPRLCIVCALYAEQERGGRKRGRHMKRGSEKEGEEGPLPHSLSRHENLQQGKFLHIPR